MGFDTAGVRGIDATGVATGATGLIPVGVRGDSKDNVGVLGISSLAGVVGRLPTAGGGFSAQGILGTTFGVATDMTTGPWAVFSQGNLGATGTKHFVEPHPGDPNKVILYTASEGRTADTFFRGTARIVDHEAVIEVPEDFRIVTAEDGLTVQLTPTGAFASMYVETHDLNRIVVRSSRDVTFHYLVQGVRRAFQDLEPVQTGHEFMPRSASEHIPAYLPKEARRRLISNGTYNEDGTVNMKTAERAGWMKIWADREAAAKVGEEGATEGARANGAH